MDELIAFGREWGSWSMAATAIAIAIRTHASTSATTVRQLSKWVTEAREEIVRLRRALGEVRGELAVARGQVVKLAQEVERLTPFEDRARCLARELREVHVSLVSGGGADKRAAELEREPVEADVIRLPPARLRQREGEA